MGWLGRKKRVSFSQAALHAVIIFLLLSTIFPIYLMVTMSLKTDFQLAVDIFGLPRPYVFDNYGEVFMKISRNLYNSIAISMISTTGIVFLSALLGFVFSRMEFPGKKLFYMGLIVLLMIPGILTLVPMLKLIETLGLRDSWWSLFLPYIAGGQVMGAILCRNMLEGQPNELYEAARIDGANTWHLFSKICIPLSLPILVTIFFMNVVSIYNDYFTPFMYLNSMDKMPITVALKLFVVNFGGATAGQGTSILYAGYVISTIPLILIFAFGSKMFVEGLTSGAVKV